MRKKEEQREQRKQRETPIHPVQNAICGCLTFLVTFLPSHGELRSCTQTERAHLAVCGSDRLSGTLAETVFALGAGLPTPPKRPTEGLPTGFGKRCQEPFSGGRLASGYIDNGKRFLTPFSCPNTMPSADREVHSTERCVPVDLATEGTVVYTPQRGRLGQR
jgi:hypothetical protein